jgi:ketosteroid isomerase-like protein
MSEQADAVKRVIDLWNRLPADPAERRDSAELAELLGHFGENLEFAQAPTFPSGAGSTGRAGFRREWEDWLRAWGDRETIVDELEERGDTVLIIVRERAVGREGVAVENHGGAVFTFAGGLIVRLASFLDQAAARREFEAAAGR